MGEKERVRRRNGDGEGLTGEGEEVRERTRDVEGARSSLAETLACRGCAQSDELPFVLLCGLLLALRLRLAPLLVPLPLPLSLPPVNLGSKHARRTNSYKREQDTKKR